MQPKYHLNDEEVKLNESYFFQCLERKKLHKNNEVVYDDVDGKIKWLNAVTFDEAKRKFVSNKDFSSSLKNNSKSNQEMKNTQKAKTQKKPRKSKETD